MKIPLELNFFEGKVFLNYWDALHGNDVMCEVVDGQLLLVFEGKGEIEEPIALDKFIELVKERETKNAI